MKSFLYVLFILLCTSNGMATQIDSSFLVKLNQDSASNQNKIILQKQSDLDKDVPDSVNRISWKDIFNGFSYYNKSSNEYYSTNSPLEMFNFNTVEGFNVNLGLKYEKRFKGENRIISSTYFRHGFSNNRFNAKSSFGWNLNPVKKSMIEIGGGRYVNQFNNNNPIHSFVNSYYSLAYRKNYMKLYGSNFGELRYEHEIFEGIFLETGILYEDRGPLSNTTNFALIKENKESGIQYSSNNPMDFAGVKDGFTKHQALSVDVKLKIKFQEQYISILDKNISLGSEYPDITMYYKRGIGAFGSDVSYNFGSINIGQNLDFGFFGVSSWDIKAGTFFNTRSIEFIDYHHFNGNETIFISYPEPYAEDRTPLTRFQLLDYYNHSTKSSFWTIHFEHYFKGFIIEKIPFLDKTNIQSVIGLNFLQTSDDVVHFEVFSGLENIFGIFRIDFLTGYNNMKRITGAVRLSLELTDL